MEENNYTQEQEVEFIKSLYDDATEQLKEVYKKQKKNKDDLLNLIAFIMLTYQISNNVMSLSSLEKANLNNRFLGLITKISKGQSTLIKDVITTILTDTVKRTNNFYGGSFELKDIEKIINKKFKGEYFTNRILKNENDIAKKLYSETRKFVQGETDVNTIKSHIDKTVNEDAYNVRRLAESEINRSENDTFITIAKESGVKKIIRHEILDDRICLDCEAIAEQIFDIDNAPDGALHSLCRGWNSVYE